MHWTVALYQPGQKHQGRKNDPEPAGGALLAVDAAFGLLESVFKCQVVLLVKAQGGHMLHPVMQIHIQRFESIGKALE